MEDTDGQVHNYTYSLHYPPGTTETNRILHII